MPSDITDMILQGVTPERSDDGIRGVLVDGVFWHWQKQIDDSSIAHDRALRSIRRFEASVAFGLGIFFTILTGVGVVFVHQADVVTLDFWTAPNWTAASLAASALSFLYMGYRNASDKRSEAPLYGVSRIGAPEFTSIASPAAVERRQDIADALDDDAIFAVEEAYRLAASSSHARVGSLHLFAGALATRSAQVLMARLGVSLNDVKDPLRRKLSTSEQGATIFGAEAHDVLAKALLRALQTKRRNLSALEILAVTFQTDEFLSEVFAAKGITPEEFENALAWMRISDDLRDRYLAFRKAAAFKPTSNMNRSMTAVATPFLDAVSEDLTRAAVFGQTVMLVDREREIANIMRAIEGGGQSVVLVGQPGVGKAAIVDGIADLMVEERVPAILQDKRLLRLSVPHIVSAQGGSGADERFLYALNQVAHAGNVVLVIENIHELIGRGSGFDLASILAGELGRGYTFLIATTTPQAYAEIVERSVISPKLQKIVIEEPSRNDAIQVLESKIGGIENKHKVIFTYGAVAAAVDLSSRYMHDGALPEKAIEIAKEVALMVSKKGQSPAWVRKEDVAALIGERTRIPVTEVTQSEGEKLLQLEERVHERVIGQERAVQAVASALRRARTELRSGKRPIANFLFLGPTGVGKTELAKATAEVYFGNEEAMIRFDMSEYQDQASVARLIGGNGQAGLMTEAVRRNPFSLVLLDELEKAHPDILNLFLQVMDDGRLTDGLGRTVDFTNVILIATSNAGTSYIQDQVARGASLDAIKEQLLEAELRQTYRPEFLNRFDDVIVFAPLTREDVVAIAYLLMAKVIDRLKEKGIAFSVTDAAIHELAELGYDPKFGARPLRRVIQEKVENPVADFLLRGQVGRRDTLILDKGGQISVEKAAEL